MSAANDDEILAGPVPCEWFPVDQLPVDRDGQPYRGKVLLLVPATCLDEPRVFEGRRIGDCLNFEDLRLERKGGVPRPVAWCELPPWPDFLPGGWQDFAVPAGKREGD